MHVPRDGKPGRLILPHPAHCGHDQHPGTPSRAEHGSPAQDGDHHLTRNRFAPHPADVGRGRDAEPRDARSSLRPAGSLPLGPVESQAACRTLPLVLRLGMTVLGVADVDRAVAFWTGALGLVASDEWASEAWRTLYHADGSGRAIGLQLSASVPERHPRVHLDLVVDDHDEQVAEVDRLIGLGARRVDWDLYPPQPDFVVLADPDGNRFCVVDLGHTPSDVH